MPVFKVVTQNKEPYGNHNQLGKYHDKDAYDDVISYVLDSDKTTEDLVGGFGVNPYMAADQFKIIARIHHKDFGVHLRHMVLSFSKKRTDRYTAGEKHCISDRRLLCGAVSDPVYGPY